MIIISVVNLTLLGVKVNPQRLVSQPLSCILAVGAVVGKLYLLTQTSETCTPFIDFIPFISVWLSQVEGILEGRTNDDLFDGAQVYVVVVVRADPLW